nr:PQQ-binding-like beta-propeller repeat protein [uncultured Caproiciproducens sp.]
MTVKKITAALCALAFVISAAVGASAADSADWPQFLGSPTASGLTTAKTSVNAASANQIWTVKHSITSEYNGAKYENNACGTPIAVGSYLYMTTADGKLLKLDAATGKTAASAECLNIPLYFSQIAFGDGKIYVPQQTFAGVQISAFDAENLTPVWQSDAIAYGESAQQISSPITYYDHRIYFGTYTQDAATYAYTSGVFVCMDTSTGKTAWLHENSTAGYYWNGSAVTGTAVAVSDTAGTITAYRLTDGAVVSTVTAGGPVSSTLCIAQGRLYASVKSGYIYSAKMDAGGMIYGSTAVKSAVLGNSITSSPVVFNNRLYVAGGGYNATTPFSVLDAESLKTIYQISGIQSQSSPLVSTAYAADKNKQQVSIYVTKYGTLDENYAFTKDSSSVYVISDHAGQTKPSYEILFTPPVPQSSSQSLVPSKDGSLFYFNDSGSLYAIARKAPLASPATGEEPVAMPIVVVMLSAAVVFVLQRKPDFSELP